MKSIAKADSEKKVAITESVDQEDIRRMRETLQRQLKAVQEADARLKGSTTLTHSEDNIARNGGEAPANYSICVPQMQCLLAA